MSKSRSTNKKSKQSTPQNEEDQPIRIPKLLALPKLQQQFKGAGRALQVSRNHRRLLSSYETEMESRVLYLMREKKKTNQGIQQKRKQLQRVVELRRRQEEERLQVILVLSQKERAKNMRDNQLNRVRNQSLMHRLSHQMNYNDSLGQLHTQRQRRYSSTKENSTQAMQYCAVQENRELLKRRSTKLLVDESVERGKERIEEFKRRQNSAYLQQYNSRIRLENTRSRSKVQRLQMLQEQQQELLEHIQKSQQLEDAFDNKLRTAVDNKLEDLENEILGGKRTRRSESSRSHRSAFSSSSKPQPKLYSIESKFDIYSSKKNLYGNYRLGNSANSSSRKSLSKQLSSKSIERKGSLAL